jgi:Flp pilus assembly protein TadD
MKHLELEEVQNLLQQGKNAEAKQRLESLPESENVEYWMLKGTIEQRFQQWGKAYNAFVKVQQIDPGHPEAKTQIAMIDSILNFRNKDQFNP